MRRRAHASAAAAPPRLSLLLPTLILLVVGLVAPPARADSAAFFCGDAASSPGLAREHALPSRLFGGRLAAFCCAGGVDDRLFTGADCEKAGVGKWRNTYGVDLNYCWGWRTPACCVDMNYNSGGIPRPKLSYCDAAYLVVPPSKDVVAKPSKRTPAPEPNTEPVAAPPPP